MRASLFSPLTSSYLGFDSFFDELGRMLDNQQTLGSGFPPFNLYKDGDNYTIELAVAGFQGRDLTVEHDEKNHVLTITGDLGARAQPQSSDRAILKQGIAQRRFIRTFTLADNLKVAAAKLESGLLTIQLVIDEERTYKPKRIPLQDVDFSQKIPELAQESSLLKPSKKREKLTDLESYQIDGDSITAKSSSWT